MLKFFDSLPPIVFILLFFFLFAGLIAFLKIFNTDNRSGRRGFRSSGRGLDSGSYSDNWSNNDWSDNSDSGGGGGDSGGGDSGGGGGGSD